MHIDNLSIRLRLRAVSNVKNFSLVILSCYFIQVQITKVLQHIKIDLFLSQPIEIFDMQEQISEEELRNQNFRYNMQQTSPSSPTLTNPLSEHLPGSPGLVVDWLSYIRFLPLPTNKYYSTFNALIKDVNKTISRQRYNVVKSGGNKKDKNGDL